MVSAVSNESHAVPSYRALGVVKDLGNPPDESAENESDGRGLGRENTGCRGLRLEPRGEDSGPYWYRLACPHVWISPLSARGLEICFILFT